MNKKFILIYLILILTLNFTCVENKSSKKEISKSEFVSIPKIDNLKFTSGISSVFQDSKGNYWFGSRQEGVSLFDGKSFEYFTANEGLSDNHIRSVQEDKNGNILLETVNGISSYDGKKIITHTTIENGVSHNEWSRSDNDLWFSAGVKEGVYSYDGQRLNYLAFPNPKVINPNNLYSVTSISKGNNDMLWIGTYAGVFSYNGIDFTIINDKTLGLDIEAEPLHIRSILEDSKGRLWIGNNGIGVLLKEGDTIINFSEKNNLIHPTSSRRGDKSRPGTVEHVFAIEEDGEGNIWFGDRDTGVWRYDGKTMKNYTINLGQSNDFVHSIYKDNNDELWFVLTNGNAFKFNGKTFDKQF